MKSRVEDSDYVIKTYVIDPKEVTDESARYHYNKLIEMGVEMGPVVQSLKIIKCNSLQAY